MLYLSDFVTCSARFNIQNEASISQLLNILGRQNLVYIHHTHIYTNWEQSYAGVIFFWVGKDFII